MATQLRESVQRNATSNGMNFSQQNIMTKWGKELGILKEAFNGKLSDDKAFGTAVLLENTDRYIRNASAHKNMFALNEATQPSDVSFFRQFAINNLLAVYPNLIATDLVSVQPLLSRAGEIRYIRAIYGSDKGGIRKGDEMFGQYNLGQHPNDYSYSSDSIEGEIVGKEQNFNLAWTPIEPGTVVMTDENGVAYRDDSTGKILKATDGTNSGTIDYATGKVTFTAAPENDLSVNYTYDNISAPVQAPEIQIKVVASPIYAKSRKLKTLYAFDAGFDMANDFAMNLSGEILSMSTAQLKREIDDEIIADLANKGTAPGTTFNMTVPDGISLVDHYAGFPAAITVASNNIWNLTQVADASWIIVGALASNIIESIPRFKSAGVVNPKGAHLIGYIDNKPVYKSAVLKENEWVVGYKGDSLFETGYVYAPYLPIMSTQLLMDETFTGRQGFTTSYGKKMTCSDYFGKSLITTN